MHSSTSSTRWHFKPSFNILVQQLAFCYMECLCMYTLAFISPNDQIKANYKKLSFILMDLFISPKHTKNILHHKIKLTNKSRNEISSKREIKPIFRTIPTLTTKKVYSTTKEIIVLLHFKTSFYFELKRKKKYTHTYIYLDFFFKGFTHTHQLKIS